MATRWTAGTPELLPGPSGASWANATSPDGSTVVGTRHSGGSHPIGFAYIDPVRWVANGTSEALAGPDLYPFSEAYDVSADGAVIVGSLMDESRTYERGFRWTSQGMLLLSDLPGGDDYSFARGVSADGARIIGASQWGVANQPESYREAVIWSETGEVIRLGDLPGGGVDSNGFAISADGNVAVGSSRSTNGWEAFRWNAQGGMVGLGQLPGGSADSSDDTAFAVSGDGRVIVGTATSPTAAYDYEAFIWDADHGMRSLKTLLTQYGVDTAGWDLIEATGVSDDGFTIVGWGYSPSGEAFEPQAWIAVIPEPGTAGLLGVGLVMLRWRRRRGESRRTR